MATTPQTAMKSVFPQTQATETQSVSHFASNTSSIIGLNKGSQPTSQIDSYPGFQSVSQALSHPFIILPCQTLPNLKTSLTNISTSPQNAMNLALPQTQVNDHAVSPVGPKTGLNAIPHPIPHLSSHTNLINHSIPGLGAGSLAPCHKRSAAEANLDAKNTGGWPWTWSSCVRA